MNLPPYRRRLLIVLLVLGLVVWQAPAVMADHSVEEVNFGECSSSPLNFYFSGKSSKTDDSRLALWVYRSSNCRFYRVTARAGSGNGSTDPCATSQGWLPAGAYGRGSGDSNTRVENMNKTWGNVVVRGNVWFLDSKRCSNDGASGTLRTELFVHSNGVEGTAWGNNWKSEGCIKVSQHARNSSGFTYYARTIAFDRNNERLAVTH